MARQATAASAQAALAMKDETLAAQGRELEAAQERGQTLTDELARVRGELAQVRNERLSFEAGRTKLQEILDVTTAELKALQAKGHEAQVVAIGNKGFGFMNRVGAKVVSSVTALGDTPHLDKLIGPVKVLLDAYQEGKLDAVYLFYTKFINTMRQEPMMQQLLPLSADSMTADKDSYSWDYLYEPDPQRVIDELMTRYVEALVAYAEGGGDPPLVLARRQ